MALAVLDSDRKVLLQVPDGYDLVDEVVRCNGGATFEVPGAVELVPLSRSDKVEIDGQWSGCFDGDGVQILPPADRWIDEDGNVCDTKPATAEIVEP